MSVCDFITYQTGASAVDLNGSTVFPIIKCFLSHNLDLLPHNYETVSYNSLALT